MYSVREASEVLGVKVRTVRTWIANGKLKARKDKGTKRWKISKRSLEKTAHDNKN